VTASVPSDRLARHTSTARNGAAVAGTGGARNHSATLAAVIA
jgi:hypothetical protein